MDWRNYKAHPAADIFPRMVGSDLESLAANISRNGQLFPVIVGKDGLVWDGRKQACSVQAGSVERHTTVDRNLQRDIKPLRFCPRC